MAVSDMEFKDIIKYEFTYMFRRNPKVALILLGLPILYTILFGFVYNANSIKNIPTLIYDQDHTMTSSALIQAVTDSYRYQIVAEVNTQEAMEESLYTNEALVAVVIPPNFARDIKLGKSSQVMITINSANLMFSNATLGSISEIVQTFSIGAGQKSLEGLSQMPSQALSSAAPIRLAVRVLHNPTLSYSNFMLAGMGAFVLQLAIMISICFILTREYTSISHLKDTSVPVILMGKLLPYWLCSMFSYVVYLAINTLFFDSPFRGDLGSLLLIGCAFTFAIINIGAFYSAAAPTQLHAVQLPMIYIMPSYLFSGYSWPLIAMNDFSQGFAAIMPITYAADVIRDILLAGYSPTLFTNTAILFAFGSVLFCLSCIIFFRRRRKILNAASLEIAS
ncbi:MAG: ABC transporter permease [Sporomusaceae bacterium]|nr:ABC transporter permease [Sporomusaceae bacterium]